MSNLVDTRWSFFNDEYWIVLDLMAGVIDTPINLIIL